MQGPRLSNAPMKDTVLELKVCSLVFVVATDSLFSLEEDDMFLLGV